MASQEDVRRIALSLPETEESTDRFAFSVRNKAKLKGFVWIWQERVELKKPRVPRPDVVAVRVADLAAKDFLDSSIIDFQRSCRRLAGISSEVGRVGVAHFGRTVIDAGILAEHADGFDRVIDGTARWRVARDYSGEVAEACFDRFSIFVPLTSEYIRGLA